MTQDKSQPTVNWELPVSQAQFILNHLTTLPFKDVNELVTSLVQQSQQKPNLKAVDKDIPDASGSEATGKAKA